MRLVRITPKAGRQCFVTTTFAEPNYDRNWKSSFSDVFARILFSVKNHGRENGNGEINARRTRAAIRARCKGVRRSDETALCFIRRPVFHFYFVSPTFARVYLAFR